ncbi:MAG: type II toxin-antitoxin system VapC family toxin [Spirochaetales bacterium]|nr:MAG: type II toxin-antitoxin system VapC family toxin [Spirochaetales bacterium]
MSGKYLLDTNAIVSLLQGNSNLVNLVVRAEWVGISIISFIEFLAFPGLQDEDKSLFYQFIERIEVIPLSNADMRLVESVLSFRKNHKLKLPDAIIAATALNKEAHLITADKQLLSIKDIQTIDI